MENVFGMMLTVMTVRTVRSNQNIFLSVIVETMRWRPEVVEETCEYQYQCKFNPASSCFQDNEIKKEIMEGSGEISGEKENQPLLEEKPKNQINDILNEWVCLLKNYFSSIFFLDFSNNSSF